LLVISPIRLKRKNEMTNHNDDAGTVNITRRAAVGGAIAGVAAAAYSGTTQAGQSMAPTATKLSNPVDIHPKPPFPSQKQPFPGLAGKMDQSQTMAKRVTRDQDDWQTERR
jgi:hypothetical protein